MRYFGLLMVLAAPSAGVPAEPDFERHVMPLLTRAGCNAGACHGAFQGKGGLRLSLFNHDPAADHAALTRDALGRRVSPSAPERSLFLLKPTGRLPHEGGVRLGPTSWEHDLLRAWIAAGARRRPGSGVVRRMEVSPAEHVFRNADPLPLRVEVEFADGTRADIAPFCDFKPRDDGVAEAGPAGVVRPRRPGDTAIIVSYLGHFRTARVFVPAPSRPGPYPALPADNVVDREVLARLRLLNLVPSAPCDDATFLRRLTIDTTGGLPSPEQVRAFLADKDPLKRVKKIDELLTHPLHAALWATRLCDATGANADLLDGPGNLKARKVGLWHAWLRKRIAENVPYDQIVEGVLCATSRGGETVGDWIRGEVTRHEALEKGAPTDYASRPYLDLFWRRGGPEGPAEPEQFAELTAAAFLGVRLECAQCHKHPFDRWTQADYRAYAAIFSRTRFGASTEVRTALQDLLDKSRQPGATLNRGFPRLLEVFVSERPGKTFADPATGRPLTPRPPGGPELATAGDPRRELFAWLTRPDNPFFARAVVNRVWAHYMGAGLVEPVDGFSAANPPSNDPLLDALARQFTHSGYNLRRLEKTILTSRTYQLSCLPTEDNAHDRSNHSRSYPRRPPAEAVADMLGDALGVARSMRAVEAAESRVNNGHLAQIFRLFGRPARTALCDCERSAEPALPQTLFLMSDPVLLEKMRSGRLKELLEGGRSDDAVFEELVLATLSRFPDDQERRWAREHLKAKKERTAAFTDLLWALINTREFILNH